MVCNVYVDGKYNLYLFNLEGGVTNSLVRHLDIILGCHVLTNGVVIE
jgi:hypothetical protein